MAKTSGSTLAVIGIAMLLLPAMVLADGPAPPPKAAANGLWTVYERSLKDAKYIDLTHTLAPSIPV